MLPIWKHLMLITDRVKAGELDIEYCPTGDMVADYFTKPLQGKKFYQFRKENYELRGLNWLDHRSVLENNYLPLLANPT